MVIRPGLYSFYIAYFPILHIAKRTHPSLNALDGFFDNLGQPLKSGCLFHSNQLRKGKGTRLKYCEFVVLLSASAFRRKYAAAVPFRKSGL